jgi:aspartate ammonia-lyase
VLEPKARDAMGHGDSHIKTRTEKDFLGEKAVPADAYWGVQTQRAVENFRISGVGPHPTFVRATVLIKKAAALANRECRVLEPRLADAIVRAADEVLAGGLADQFVVDVYQAGAGTSHHMNVNEVLANRANELLGGRRGAYEPVHPNDHVNYGQSTNDVVPTAIRIAALLMLDELYPALEALAAAFDRKAREFRAVVKSGRTHLQDAVPVTLGQEFGGWAETVRRGTEHLRRSAETLCALGIGGTAVGTGLNTAPGYRERVVAHLAELTGLPLTASPNLFGAMQSLAPMVALSGALRGLAVEVGRIAADLRLLSSGPRTGLAEIRLPEVQPGSSIMPGKVNPVIAEMTEMVCFRVMGNDAVVAAAARAGQLELNVMMPLVAATLCESLQIFTNAVRTLTTRCVEGITADVERCRAYAERSVALATVLNPVLGYHAAAEVARESLETGASPREIILRKKLLPPDEVERLFSAAGMANIREDDAQ